MGSMRWHAASNYRTDVPFELDSDLKNLAQKQHMVEPKWASSGSK